jgi:8-amino-7-oxononanoate synthase
MPDPYDWLTKSLATIHQAQWHRAPAAISHLQGTKIVVSGQELTNFAGNDYLSLAQDPRLQQAAIAAIQEYGTGSTGSRLVTGQRPIHRELEAAIAQFKGTADALVFSSGFAANLGTIMALVDRRDLILSDRYNHASIQSGSQASGSTILTYGHCNLAELRQLLATHRTAYRRCLIVTDSVFSMDGDLCPLPTILDLAQEFDSMLLVDEAHATGVLGPSGAGAIEHFGLVGQPIVDVGTLSKALGSLGGYVAGSIQLIDYLRNRCGSWIYTTGLSPADAAAALAAIRAIAAEPERRQQLWQNIDFLKSSLGQVQLGRMLPSDSAVICWELPSVAIALQVSSSLRDLGIFAPAIRPPTVPTSRIRLTVCAGHHQTDLDRLGHSIQQIACTWANLPRSGVADRL